MTAIGSVAGTEATASKATTTNSANTTSTLDYNAFLKLLIAQMQNQDPLNPMDSTEYVSQLASFSNVEQGLKMNTKLDQLLVLSNLAQANNVVGATITSADGTTTGVVKSVKIDSSSAVATLTNGSEVKLESGIILGSS